MAGLRAGATAVDLQDEVGEARRGKGWDAVEVEEGGEEARVEKWQRGAQGAMEETGDVAEVVEEAGACEEMGVGILETGKGSAKGAVELGNGSRGEDGYGGAPATGGLPHVPTGLREVL